MAGEVFDPNKVYVRSGTRNILSSTPNLDAFGRLRVSNPTTLLDNTFQYNLSPLTWNQKTVGAATIAHVPAESSAQLNTTTASGDRAVLQSKRYTRYQPGKSQEVIITGAFGATELGCEKKIGYFDDTNGVFFSITSEGELAWTVRSNTSGTPVDNTVVQSEWNADWLNGNGPSKVTLNSENSFIVFIDLEWLSYGRVRVGFVVGGKIIYAHEFYHSNLIVGPYMATANLPVRYEIENTAAISSADTMHAVCATVMSEGGFSEEFGFSFSASTGSSTRTATAGSQLPLIAIRPKLLFYGLTNRADRVFQYYSLLNTGNEDIIVRIIYDATIGDGSWVSVDSNSTVEYNITATTFSGGTLLSTEFVPATNQNPTSSLTNLIDRLTLSLDIDGTAQETLLISVQSLANTSAVSASMNWKEYY